MVTAPVDLVKVRLQSQTKGWAGVGGDGYRGPIHCVTVILREEGPRGLFRGGLALTLRDVPCYGIYFLPYEITCRFLTEEGKRPGQLEREIVFQAIFSCEKIAILYVVPEMLRSSPCILRYKLLYVTAIETTWSVCVSLTVQRPC